MTISYRRGVSPVAPHARGAELHHRPATGTLDESAGGLRKTGWGVKPSLAVRDLVVSYEQDPGRYIARKMEDPTGTRFRVAIEVDGLFGRRAVSSHDAVRRLQTGKPVRFTVFDHLSGVDPGARDAVTIKAPTQTLRSLTELTRWWKDVGSDFYD